MGATLLTACAAPECAGRDKMIPRGSSRAAGGTFLFCVFLYTPAERIGGSRIIQALDKFVHVVGNIVLGRLYLTRQAASLLRFAKSTSNPELAAVLVQKAADLKAQTEPPTRSIEDKSPLAPDIECSGLPSNFEGRS